VRGRSLVLPGLWWRRGLNLAVLSVAVVTTTAAALGPLYARASTESTLNDHLTEAGSTTGLHFYAYVDATIQRDIDRFESTAPRPGAILGYDSAIDGIYTPEKVGVSTSAEGHGAVTSHLLWRAGMCQHVAIVHGRCPSGPLEMMASQRTFDSGAYGWRIGTKLYIGALSVEGFDGNPKGAVLRVVGTYRQNDVNDPYWFGRNYADQQFRGDQPDLVDTLMVSRATFAALPRPAFAQAEVDMPLNPGALRLSDVAHERRAVAATVGRYQASQEIHVTTQLRLVLDDAHREQQLVEVGTLLVTLQLGLLAWLVLFQVVADAIEARGNEIAMAKLRGLSPAATVRFGLAEPVVLLALAVPVGLLAAVGVTHVFAGSVLVPGVPVVMAWAPIVAALIAFGGGLVAAALAGYRTLTRGVLDQWRRTTRAPGHSRIGLVIDALLALVAVTGLAALRAHHHARDTHDSATLLAPGLLVFAVALLGVRLLPLGCRWIAGRTRASRRMGLFLASRQVARRPVGLRLAALLAVAVGLATFAVAGESVARSNRAARAQSELGASQVASIQYDAKQDPVAATHTADPDGRWAMAVATWLPDGGETVTGTVIGVDGSRLAAVAYRPAGGPALASMGEAVGAASVRPITLTAPQIRLHITGRDLSAGTPYVQLNLRTARDAFVDVQLERLRAGAHVYVASLPCKPGCLFRGITWDRPITVEGTMRGTATLTGIDIGDGTTWRPLDASLTNPDGWRAAAPQGEATDELHVSFTGVTDRFRAINGGYGGILYAYAPSPIPAVATPGSYVSNPKLAMEDLLGAQATFNVIQSADVLPDVLDNGVLMNLPFVQAELPAFSEEATWSVWLGPRAPPDARARLEAAGFHVQSVRTERQRTDQLARQGPALALLLLLACAVAGAVLAVGGTAISIAASSRRRSYEIAALRTVGLPRAALLRAGVIEQLLLLGAAVALGVPTGLLAARLAMPVIPEFSDTTPVALHYVPRLAPTAIFASAFIVLLTITAVLAAAWLMRTAVPDRLREAEG
jgi:putative ABC transport system permease protein